MDLLVEMKRERLLGWARATPRRATERVRLLAASERHAHAVRRAGGPSVGRGRGNAERHGAAYARRERALDDVRCRAGTRTTSRLAPAATCAVVAGRSRTLPRRGHFIYADHAQRHASANGQRAPRRRGARAGRGRPRGSLAALRDRPHEQRSGRPGAGISGCARGTGAGQRGGRRSGTLRTRRSRRARRLEARGNPWPAGQVAAGLARVEARGPPRRPSVRRPGAEVAIGAGVGEEV